MRLGQPFLLQALLSCARTASGASFSSVWQKVFPIRLAPPFSRANPSSLFEVEGTWLYLLARVEGVFLRADWGQGHRTAASQTKVSNKARRRPFLRYAGRNAPLITAAQQVLIELVRASAYDAGSCAVRGRSCSTAIGFCLSCPTGVSEQLQPRCH